MAAALPPLIGDDPRDPAEVLAAVTDAILPTSIAVDSPRYFAFIPNAPTKAAVMFDMVVSAAAINGISWLDGAGAVWAENEALAVLAAVMNMPLGAGGCFVSGGSAGNLSALAVARDCARERCGDPRRAMALVAARSSHASVRNCAALLDLDVIEVEPDAEDRLTADAVAAALAEPGLRERVAAVVATAGSTNTGTIDDLAGISDVCAAAGVWLHVDAAYGGAACFSAQPPERLAGLGRADSIVLDPHKWLFGPFDCGAVLYADPAAALPTHRQRASYLDTLYADDEGWNPSDFSHHLSRRARGLPLWFSMAIHGRAAYGRAVDACFAMARWTADQVRLRPDLELLVEPELSVVVFRRRPVPSDPAARWTATRYAEWCRDLLARDVAFLQPTTHKGEPAVRMVFLHPDTTRDTVAAVLDDLCVPLSTNR